MSRTPTHPPTDPVRRFRDLWQQAPPPDLDAFLAGAGTLTPDQLAALVRIDQAERRRRGEWVPAEDYLRRHPALRADSENALVVIYGEYLLREQQGEAPSPEEYARRFPALAEPLRLQVVLHQALESDPELTTPQAPPSHEPLAATPQLPDFEILGELGRGGMGVVYRARQTKLNRLVALKMIRDGVGGDPELVARFRREAELAARLQHPNIVQVYEVGEHGEVPYLALELVEGGSLAGRLLGAPQPPREAAALVHTLAGATHAAHLRGVVHRDLKPRNVLLSVSRERSASASPEALAERLRLTEAIPKIADFGLARQLDDDAGQTQSGVVVGTPSYMAPEQAAGRTREIGPACDVYGLGAILYECLTGRPPFRATTAADTLDLVRNADPVPPRRLQPKVPRDLETICLKCLQKEPQQRYLSALALADDLGRFLDGRPIAARPVGAVRRAAKWARRRPAVAALSLAVAALLAGLIGALGLELQHSEERRRAADAEAKVQARLRDEADVQRDEAKRLAAAALAEFGAVRCEQGDVTQGVLLLARALEATPPRAREQQRSLRRVLAGWIPDLCPTRAVLPIGAEVTAVGFSPDGRSLLVATPTQLRARDAVTGAPVGPPCPLRPDGSHHVLALSPDGTRALVEDGPARDGLGPQLRLWDLTAGEFVGPPLEHHTRLVVGAFSRDGKVFATGGGWVNRGEARLWDAATGQPLGPPLPHRARITSVSVAPDDRTLLTACGEVWMADDPKTIKVRLWDAPAGALLRECPRDGTTMHPDRAAFAPDGKSFVTIMNDRARRWDTATGAPLGEPWPVGRARDMAIAPDGNTLLVRAWADEWVRLWDLHTGEPLGEPIRCLRQVRSAAFRPDGRAVVTGSAGGAARVWEVPAPRRKVVALPHPGAVTLAAFRPDGRTILTACADGAVREWELAGPGRPESARLLGERLRGAKRVWAISPDGRTAATGGFRLPPRLWDLGRGAALGEPLDHRGAEVVCLAFSPDGKLVATGSNAGRVFDAATGKRLSETAPHAMTVAAVALGHDGRLLTGSWDRTARLWDAASGEAVGAPLHHGDFVLAVALSPDGRTALTGSKDGTARLWDVDTGAARGGPLPHEGEVVAVAFSPDGRLALTGAKDHTARWWDVATGRPVGAPLTHPYPVRLVAFSPDGALALTACVNEAPGRSDGTVRLWDVASGRAVGPPLAHPAGAVVLAFRPDGRLLLAACGRDALLRRVPEPLDDEPTRLRLRLEIGLGKWLDEGGAVHDLDLAGLDERARRLQEASANE